MKKIQKIILSILLITLLIAGGTTYFITKKDKINIFDYTKLDFYGANTEGTVLIRPNKDKINADFADKETQDKITQIINNLTFKLNKDQKLLNNEELIISIDIKENKNTLNQYKVRLEQTELTHMITELPTIPSWENIKNKDIIDSTIKDKIQKAIDLGHIKEQESNVKQLGKEVPMYIYETLEAIYYKQDFKNCGMTTNYDKNQEYCGTIIYLYRYDFEFVDSDRYYFTEYKPSYQVHKVTNIYDENEAYIYPEDLEKGWYSDIEDLEERYSNLRYQKIY